jgi:hypothetical protein
MLKLEGLREKVARQFGWATAKPMLPPKRLTQTLYNWRHNIAGRFRETPRLLKTKQDRGNLL